MTPAIRRTVPAEMPSALRAPVCNLFDGLTAPCTDHVGPPHQERTLPCGQRLGAKRAAHVGHRRSSKRCRPKPTIARNCASRPLERLGLDGLSLFAQLYHAPDQRAQRATPTWIAMLEGIDASRSVQQFCLAAASLEAKDAPGNARRKAPPPYRRIPCDAQPIDARYGAGSGQLSESDRRQSTQLRV